MTVTSDFNPTVANRARYVMSAYLDRRQGYDPDGLAEALKGDPAAAGLAIVWHLGLWLLTLRALSGFFVGTATVAAFDGHPLTPFGLGCLAFALVVLVVAPAVRR